MLFFCRGQYQYIESARGPTFFSRRGIEATSTLRASALYRHAEIDRRRFFSREASKTGHARNSGRKRRTIRQSERVEREARARERERRTRTEKRDGEDRFRIEREHRREIGRVGETRAAPLFRCRAVFRVALFLTAEIYICRHRVGHFFSRLGSLSVATMVIKSRVNEPH